MNNFKNNQLATPKGHFLKNIRKYTILKGGNKKIKNLKNNYLRG